MALLDLLVSVVGSHKDTNFESNSQHKLKGLLSEEVVGSHKDTNFESNSQLSFHIIRRRIRCLQSQRYKL